MSPCKSSDYIVILKILNNYNHLTKGQLLPPDHPDQTEEISTAFENNFCLSTQSNMPRVFLITGTTTGFGYELVKKVLAEGDIAVATARDSSKLKFDNTTSDNFLAVDLDVTQKQSIDAAFDKALSQFKRVDVVVNNAGYGLSGAFETLADKQIRTQMEVNFFGLIDVTRKALEVMREKNSPPGGLIQQVTSIGGQRGFPSFSIYCASKWAVEGFTEAVSAEVSHCLFPSIL